MFHELTADMFAYTHTRLSKSGRTTNFKAI